MITENLSTLKIHKLTQAQYDRELANGTIDETALYLTSDEAVPNIIVTIDTSWTEDTINGGYTKTVAVAGMLATDTPFVDVVLGDNIEANVTALKAWNLVTRITTAENSITLYANGDAPTTAFDIQLKVVR
ncbi:MAG: hypothetical protein IKY26_00155 [Erysipelotrichaceae bacterium]|nr:hypothetical protein [Erysipelotrichaceae bacterium]